MFRNCTKIINKVIFLLKQLICDFIIARSFNKPLLSFWVEIRKNCLWNCCPRPSNNFVPQIKLDLKSCHYPLINYLAPIQDLAQMVKKIKPTCLIGAAAIGGVFTQEIIEDMATFNETPIIFALRFFKVFRNKNILSLGISILIALRI